MASIMEKLRVAKAARGASIKERQEAAERLLQDNLRDVDENELTDAQIELMERMIAKRKEPTL
ncbi:hypothetical protein MQM1_042 [Aeromonas phage vB_AsaP_MQM1]|nr:hypothetical protein MQM1_042 [Aeromonas phage vB_AsaP_MQM1]